MTHRRGASSRIRLCAEGLSLAIEPIGTGKLAPAVRLQVYAGNQATSVGATIPAGDADQLAAAIVAAGKRAAEAQLWAPAATGTEP